MYEKQLNQISNTKMTLENQQMTLESMNLNRGGPERLEGGRAEHGRADQGHGRRRGGGRGDGPRWRDGLNDAEEIAEALAQVNVPSVDADEDDLLAELEGLEAADLASQLGEVDLSAGEVDATAKQMPDVPFSLPDAPTRAMTAGERAGGAGRAWPCEPALPPSPSPRAGRVSLEPVSPCWCMLRSVERGPGRTPRSERDPRCVCKCPQRGARAREIS